VIIYFATGNLFVAVGTHALMDAYMLIPHDSFRFADDFDFVYLGLGLLAAILWRFVWPGVTPAYANEI
jgi:hypothetical protein